MVYESTIVMKKCACRLKQNLDFLIWVVADDVHEIASGDKHDMVDWKRHDQSGFLQVLCALDGVEETTDLLECDALSNNVRSFCQSNPCPF